MEVKTETIRNLLKSNVNYELYQCLPTYHHTNQLPNFSEHIKTMFPISAPSSLTVIWL